MSFGSTLSPSAMGEERRDVFIDTFRRSIIILDYIFVFVSRLDLPVIWKWDSELPPNLPPNVHTFPWLPQVGQVPCTQQWEVPHIYCNCIVTRDFMKAQAIFHRIP